MKRLLTSAIALALGIAAGTAHAADKVTLQLKWVTQAQFAGYYVALDKGFYKVPVAINEPIKSYAPGTSERAEVQAAYDKMWAESLDIPMVINGKQVRTSNTMRVLPPHDPQHNVGSFHFG